MSTPAWRVVLLVLMLGTTRVAAQEMPPDYDEALQVLGRPGDFKDAVLRVGLPRNDLEVVVDGVAAPTPLGFGGWIAMTKGEGGMDVLMGDLVLTEDEVNPVISALLEHGLDVTALHNHFFWETPRVFYLHVHGHGRAAELATSIKPALDLVGSVPRRTPKGAPASPPRRAGSIATGPPLDPAAISKLLGHPGEQTGAVYKVTIGRPDIALKEMGASINARMGLNTWAAFAGSATDAVVAGDVAMLASEVTPVVKALRRHSVDVVAIHHHMLGSDPAVYFLHYWGRGPVEQLARAVRAALDELSKKPGR